jgi:exodeoxyribonuclease VII small subunit
MAASKALYYQLLNMKEPELDFNQSLTRLKEIVTKLEDTNLSLEEGIKLIEEGIALHKQCKEKLDKAQIKITKLFEEKESTEPAAS